MNRIYTMKLLILFPQMIWIYELKNGSVESKMRSAITPSINDRMFVFIGNEYNLRTLILFLSHSAVVNFTLNQWQYVEILFKLFHLVNCALSHITFKMYSFSFWIFYCFDAENNAFYCVYAQINWIHISTLSTLVCCLF